MFEISFRAREARRRHQLLGARYESCPRLGSLLSETVFRRKLYLVKPICGRMNNCLNGRRRRRHCHENIIPRR